ncbi:MAG: hypothetical protein HYY45_08855 [Deltaproteobacteria bacterium]|nr:hypothetical protein [Deltaproteobacteria bacterium]
MSIGFVKPGRLFICSAIVAILIYSGYPPSPVFAAEATEKKELSETKDSFNLILPYTDLTVGQGR